MAPRVWPRRSEGGPAFGALNKGPRRARARGGAWRGRVHRRGVWAVPWYRCRRWEWARGWPRRWPAPGLPCAGAGACRRDAAPGTVGRRLRVCAGRGEGHGARERPPGAGGFRDGVPGWAGVWACDLAALDQARALVGHPALSRHNGAALATAGARPCSRVPAKHRRRCPVHGPRSALCLRAGLGGGGGDRVGRPAPLGLGHPGSGGGRRRGEPGHGLGVSLRCLDPRSCPG